MHLVVERKRGKQRLILAIGPRREKEAISQRNKSDISETSDQSLLIC
jgi:hypothetical protein